MNRKIVHLKHNLPAGVQTRLHQILHHFLLRVNRNGAATGQLGQIDAMTPPAEAEPNAIVPQSFALQALAHAGFDHQVHRALLQHARAHAILDVLAAAALQNHGLDPVQMQQMGEHQPGRSGSDNTDLGSHSMLF